MDQPQVVAALITGGAAILAAVFSGLAAWRVGNLSGKVQQSIADRSTETNLIVTALNHLVGGSQERTAGVAALRVLKDTALSDRWHDYDDAVRNLLTTQLQFILARGRNRWEAHEIANAQEIARWFLDTNGQIRSGHAQTGVTIAAQRYISDWGNKERRDGDKYDDGGRADCRAVEQLIEDLRCWLPLIES
jgi:hypothetical protein